MTTQLKENFSLSLYFEMLKIRKIEETIANRYQEQKMRCPVHLSIGQEGVAVGVCKALLQTDYAVSNHRAHAHYLAKGGDLKRMIAEIYGKKTGCCLGRGGSMHVVDLSVGFYGSTPIVGGSIPVGVGISFASQMQGEKNIMTIFVGEGATEEGVFLESVNFAALKNLPILFVCENNYYSVYSPLSVRQPKERDRVALAKAHGLYVDQGFGNDVEEVYAKTQKAVDFIREGNGPAYVEFETYRHREHCGPFFDNHIGYRTEAEFLEWEKKCPLKIQRTKIDTESEKLSLKEKEIEKEIEDAFLFAEESPFPIFHPDEETPYAT